MSKLLELREKANLTQEELAEKSGVSVRTIQRIEAGTEPKGHTRRSVARALGVKECELVEIKGTDPADQSDFTFLKLINLSSLPFTVLPPANIVLPIILMFAKRQFNPLAKQIVSVQIFWTILSVIIFMVGSFAKNWFGLGSKFILIVMVLLVLANVFFILRNAAEIDRKHKLFIKLGFSLI